MVHPFTIEKNKYLTRCDVQGWHSCEYTGFQQPENPDYINFLKNTFAKSSVASLAAAADQLHGVLLRDLPLIKGDADCLIHVACVPRAKVSYHPSQLKFRDTVASVVSVLDGFEYLEALERTKDTLTTHLKHAQNMSIVNDGDEPYPGITKDTCSISPAVRGKNILLIDDIYTKNVNIDEDALQALLDAGAASVEFYAVGKTRRST